MLEGGVAGNAVDRRRIAFVGSAICPPKGGRYRRKYFEANG
jgi:hypothetical protein